MALSSITKSPPRFHLPAKPIPLHLSPVTLSFHPYKTALSHLRLCALRHGSQEPYGSEFLRKPVVSPEKDSIRFFPGEEEKWIDWEDKILEDTLPLVGFVRMILHSGKYESGDRLSPQHERTVLERLLPYHPAYQKKIGCGIDYVTVGYHPNFERSRCLFIVRNDGEFEDFSYWKCIKGLVRKNYPLYADSFILRHFRQHRSELG